MNNELINQKSWWKKNWKWIVPVSALLLLFVGIFFSSGMNGVATDLAQSYADSELYENALNKVKADERVVKQLGEIQPIDKLAILEGQVEYSNNNESVKTTIRVIGTKGKASMDIEADRIDDKWNYKKIDIRIKTPPEKKQTIKILTSE